jgi:D-alanine-D-alanine ligase
MQSIARRAFEAIGGAGLARVDFFLTKDGFLVNEINTMPGFTPLSMFPMLWQASGIDYPDLISELIDLALEEHL